MESTIATSEHDVFCDFANFFSLEGKKVLEIGGCLPYEHIKGYNVKAWFAVDPRNENRTFNYGYELIKGYAQLLPFKEGEFDYIFSCNAFHHISAFEHALMEMYRVLKPGGILYANFGPIWTAPDGSHIENVEYKGNIYNFWENPLIPDWYHLIYNCRELYEILCSGLDHGLAKVIAEYVYMSNWLSRLTYADYKRIISDSPFKIEFFEGITEFGYEYKMPEYTNNYSSKADEWLKRVGDNIENYKYRDLKICLLK